MCIGLHAKYPLYLPVFNESLNFLDRFPKNTQMSNFVKIRPVGTELFHADGRTDGPADVTKLIDLISNFRRVLNVMCFLLGNSLASEFYMPTFRNTLSVPSS